MINPHDHLQRIVDLTEEYALADFKLTALESLKPAIKAIQMKESKQVSAVLKEMDAYSSKAFTQHCEEYAEAKRIYTSLRLQIESAKLHLEVWRSQEASNRTTDKTLR
jgi:fructose/tagatose bisphosphate aldolase